MRKAKATATSKDGKVYRVVSWGTGGYYRVERRWGTRWHPVEDMMRTYDNACAHMHQLAGTIPGGRP